MDKMNWNLDDLDLNMVAIVAGIVIVVFIAVYFVSVMGIQEKTYDEKIAEQKKLAGNLLGTEKKKKKEKPAKDKKEKKDKKKKVTHEEPEHNLNFKAEPEYIDSAVKRRPSMVDPAHMKSILVNKEESSPVRSLGPYGDSSMIEENSFEKTHPKDDLELRKSFDESSRNGDDEKDDVTDSLENQLEVELEVDDADEKASDDNSSSLPVPASASSSSTSQQPQQQPQYKQSPSAVRHEKKKRKEMEVTYDKLESIIASLHLSKHEIQHLIDVLLNKEDSEWVSASKSADAVTTLKKQLADSLKLNEEDSRTVLGLQQKLKDLRMELSAEKNKSTAVKKSFDDQSLKLNDFMNLQHKEKANLQRDLQQHSNALKQLQGENISLKNALDNARKAEREVDALKAQLGHMEKQITLSFNSNQDLTNKARTLQETLMIESKRREDMAALNNQFKDREAHYINEIKIRDEACSNIDSIKAEMSREVYLLNERNKHSEEAKKELEADKVNNQKLVEASKKEIEELKRQVASKENDHKKDEKSNLKNFEDKCQELEDLKKRLASKENEQKAQEENNLKIIKDKTVEIDDLKKRINENVQEFQNLNQSSKEKDQLAEKLKEMDDLKRSDEMRIQQLELLNTQLLNNKREIEEKIVQLEKNNENQLQQQQQQQQQNENTNKNDIDYRLEMQRLFPAFNLSNESSWTEDFADQVAKLNEFQEQKWIQKCQDQAAEIENYKTESEKLLHFQTVLGQTEKLLSNLQNSIEVEEQNWKTKLDQKEKEILLLKAQTTLSTSTPLPSQTPSSPSNKLVDSIIEPEKTNGNGMIESSTILVEPVDSKSTAITNNSSAIQPAQKQKRKKGTKNK